MPGLKALHNSYLRNSADGFDFVAMIEGTAEFCDHVEHDLGITTIRNPALPLERLPTSPAWPTSPVTTFYRLLVPSLLPDCPRSIYIDVDALILQSLKPLAQLQFDAIIAATIARTTQGHDVTLGEEISNVESARRAELGFTASLMVINHAAWNSADVLGRCAAAVRTDLSFYCMDQSLLRYVIGRQWSALPYHWQVHAGMPTFDKFSLGTILVLHFMGTKPWREYPPHIVPTSGKLRARQLWERYR